MNRQSYLHGFFLLCAVLLGGWSNVRAAQQQSTSAPYLWEKDVVYALDTSRPNTIVQLPVLRLSAKHLAYTGGVTQKNRMAVLLIEPDCKQAREQTIEFPETIDKNGDGARSRLPYARYGFAGLKNPYSVWLFPPSVNYGNTALLLLSPQPLRQWTIATPPKNMTVTECALTSPRRGEVLISYKWADKEDENQPNQLALFDLETGKVIDLPGATTYEGKGGENLPVTYALWLNDHEVALTFQGRKNADWKIYEIPSGKLLGEGMYIDGPVKDWAFTGFYVAHGRLLTGMKENIISLYPENRNRNNR